MVNSDPSTRVSERDFVANPGEVFRRAADGPVTLTDDKGQPTAVVWVPRDGSPPANSSDHEKARGDSKIEQLCAERDALRKALRMDSPTSLPSVLDELERAVLHLLDDHDCDTDGHENFRRAVRASSEIRKDLLASTTGGAATMADDRSFWGRVEEAEDEVATWPSWKRAAANRVYLNEPEPLTDADLDRLDEEATEFLAAVTAGTEPMERLTGEDMCIRLRAREKSTMAKYEYHIEANLNDRWIQLPSSNEGLEFLRGYLLGTHDIARMSPAMRIVRSDGRVMETHEDRSEVPIGMIAGFPTAEQYEAAAQRALEKASRIREMNAQRRRNE